MPGRGSRRARVLGHSKEPRSKGGGGGDMRLRAPAQPAFAQDTLSSQCAAAHPRLHSGDCFVYFCVQST